MSREFVLALVVAGAVGAAAAGAHPTGTPVLDAVYSAAVAALVTAAGARARRWTWLTLAAVAVLMSRGILLIPASAALVVAFGAVWPRRPPRWAGAVVGALAIQVILRWPQRGFQGLTVLVAAAATFPLLVSAYRASPAPVRAWARRVSGAVVAIVVVGAVPLGLAALKARGAVSAGVHATEQALAALSGSHAATAIAELGLAHRDFVAAAHDTGSWWTIVARLVPVVSQQRRALIGALAAGRDLTAVGGGEAARIDYSALGYHQGHVDLAGMQAMAAPIALLDRQLALAQVQLAAIRSPWLVVPIQTRLDRLGAKLDHTKASAELADLAVRDGPAMLGAKGSRRYLIVFMTPSESRGLDGFIGSFAELTADQGSLTLTRAGPIGELQQGFAAGTRTLSGPTDYLARYGGFHPADFFQDLSYSPDFPTVAGVIAQLYPQSGGDHLDGVVALDPDGLAAMLAFTGPIAVAGLSQPLTSANAAGVLLKDQYTIFESAPRGSVTRHDFLQDALRQAFAKFVSGSLPSPETLAADLDPAVRVGRILLWSSHPDEQPLLHRLHLDGSFPAPEAGDLLAVTTQNAGNNKIDAYLHRSIDDQVTVDPGTGHVEATLKVTLRNEAPAAGLPAIVLASPAVPGLPAGTNHTWLSVYTPLGLLHASLNGEPLLLSSGTELGVKVFSGYIDIPPGGTVTVGLVLAGVLAPSSSYALALRNQPVVNADQVTVDVKPTVGWVNSIPDDPRQAAIWAPGTDAVQHHEFPFVRA